uniref:Class I histocompatibility antigen, F10 alpha chain-like n=1 Tax=Nothoprocta perdicaria TaxID=30464 RepID=A0A8C7EDT8_NOTPE
ARPCGTRPGPLRLPLLSPRPPGPHSLRYFYTGVTEPSAGLPAFVVVGVLDGQVEFVRYDSETRRTEPRVPWMQREGQQYWDRQTQIAQSHQQGFHVGLDTLQKRYNQSGGYHTVQRMCGCDILENGEIRGYEQYAYDGRDFIALNKDALTYTAADSAAVITKRKWEQAGEPERMKNYLDEICVEWLRKYVEYGKAALERREPPAVKVSGREDDERLTLSCRAHGFYPRPIVLTWLRDGAAQDMETRRSSVAPNGDGTYHTWATIEVLPEHRAQYVCRVEHASLTEPGFYSWGERGACGAPAVLARGGFAAAAHGAALFQSPRAASCPRSSGPSWPCSSSPPSSSASWSGRSLLPRRPARATWWPRVSGGRGDGAGGHGDGGGGHGAPVSPLLCSHDHSSLSGHDINKDGAKEGEDSRRAARPPLGAGSPPLPYLSPLVLAGSKLPL